jgi:hypothetical protein
MNKSQAILTRSCAEIFKAESDKLREALYKISLDVIKLRSAHEDQHDQLTAILRFVVKLEHSLPEPIAVEGQSANGLTVAHRQFL